MKQDPMVIFGVIVVIAIVLTPYAIEATTGTIGSAWDAWKNLWPTPTANGDIGPSETGYSGLGLTIYYEDGTKRDFKPTTFSMFPLEISDGGGAVSKVEVKVYVKPVTTEPATQWTVNGKLVISYQQGEKWALQTLEDWTEIRSETKTITASKTESWQSGVEKQVYTTSIVASHIEGMVSAYGEGEYRMAFTCDIEIGFSFQDGSTEKKSAEATTTWRFDYSLIPSPDPPGPEPPTPKFSSVSVRMYAGPLH